MSAKFVIKNKPFSKCPWKTLIILTACNFNKNAFLEHLPMAASGNVTKYAVSSQYEKYDSISVYNDIFQ